MQNFTGSLFKSTAGILCVCCLLFSASFSFAATSPTASENATAITSSAASSVSAIQSGQEPASVSSAAPLKPAVSTKTTSASQLTSLAGGLALILILIYGLSWFVKRFSQGGFLNNPTMKIVSAMPLGTRERLMLVDVGGKQLLLGVTATQINTLHVFDEPVVSTEKNQPATSDFSQKLMAVLQQKNVASGASSATESPNTTSNS
ncbi:flagellar biosynthetic protein FliO [Cellvibrio sp.]|uniref:flagellar biosynthetic protein FliO n=1 Tax=Cellvibrio sp. TaxID=1965322 RepID=UPI003964796B